MADSFTQQAIQIDWAKAEPRHAAICVPGVVVPLLVCVLLGYPGTGVLLAAGAVCVGYGSFQKPLIWRWGPMLAASIGISVSTTLGMLVRDHVYAYGVVVALWAFLAGLANAIGPASAWVWTQCCVYLVVSEGAPRVLDSGMGVVQLAFLRGAGTFAGAILQMLLIMLLWKLFPQLESTYKDPGETLDRLHPRILFQQIIKRTRSFRFALQMSATAVLAILVYHRVHFENAYWLMMTALLLPKPALRDTTLRSFLRFAGTVAGALVCTFLTVVFRPAGEMLTLLVAIFLYMGYWLLNVNYGIFAACITGYIVFLLAVVRLPERATMMHRTEATLLGCTIGLSLHLFWRWVWPIQNDASLELPEIK